MTGLPLGSSAISRNSRLWFPLESGLTEDTRSEIETAYLHGVKFLDLKIGPLFFSAESEGPRLIKYNKVVQRNVNKALTSADFYVR